MASTSLKTNQKSKIYSIGQNGISDLDEVESGLVLTKLFANGSNILRAKNSLNQILKDNPKMKYTILALVLYPALKWSLYGENITDIMQNAHFDSDAFLLETQRILRSVFGVGKTLDLECRNKYFETCKHVIDEIDTAVLRLVNGNNEHGKHMDRMNESISFIYQIRLALIALSFTFLYINANISIMLSFAVVFISTLFVRPIRYTKGLKRDIIKPSKNKTVSQNDSPSKQDEKSQNDWRTPPKKFNEWTENARDLWNVNHNIQERKDCEMASEQQISKETQESVPNVRSDTSDTESQEFFTQDEMDADAHEDVSTKYAESTAETPSSVVNVPKQEMVSDVSSSDLGDTKGFDTEHANDDPFADADDEIGSFEPPQNIGDDMSFEPDASITESEYNPEDFPDDIDMEQNHVDEMPSEFSDEAEVLNSEQVQQENEQESTKDEGAESDLEEVQMVDETEVQDMSSQEASSEDIEVLKEQPIVADIIDSNGNVIRTHQEASSTSSKKAAKNTRRKKKGLMSTLVDQYTSQ